MGQTGGMEQTEGIEEIGIMGEEGRTVSFCGKRIKTCFDLREPLGLLSLFVCFTFLFLCLSSIFMSILFFCFFVFVSLLTYGFSGPIK